MRSKSLFLFTLLAVVAVVPPLTQGQQTPLPPGAQSPDAPDSAPQPTGKPTQPGLKIRSIDPALAAAEDKMEARQFDTARPMVLSFLEAHPGDARALFDLGYIQDSSGQEVEAEASYRKAIAADPKQFEAHAALGLLLAQSGQHAEGAMDELKTASGLEPASGDAAAKAQVWRTLAQLQVAQDPAAAKESLLRALQLKPGESTLADLLLTAQIAEANADDETAETAYRRALALQPGSGTATAGLVHLLLKKKKYPEAETMVRGALAKAPEDPTLNSQLASVLAREGKLDEAIKALETLHAQQPADASVGRMLGDAYLQAGAPDKAEPLLAAALQAAPKDVELLNDEGQSLILTRRFAEAIPVLQRATQQDPRDVDAWNGLAYAYSQTHQDSMTLKSLAARSKIAQDTPVTLFLWATAYDNVHQSRAAAEYYHKFLEAAHGKFPDEEWQARHRLVALEKAH